MAYDRIKEVKNCKYRNAKITILLPDVKVSTLKKKATLNMRLRCSTLLNSTRLVTLTHDVKKIVDYIRSRHSTDPMFLRAALGLAILRTNITKKKKRVRHNYLLLINKGSNQTKTPFHKLCWNKSPSSRFPLLTLLLTLLLTSIHTSLSHTHKTHSYSRVTVIKRTHIHTYTHSRAH